MSVTAHFDGRVFVPDEPVDIPVGHRVRVVFEAEPASRPLAGLLADLRQCTDNTDAPADAASQHDHYLYGMPKRP